MGNKLLWLFIRIERFLVRLHLSWIAKFVVFFVRIVFSAQIPETVFVGRGTVFGYAGLGVVIHKASKIGRNCRIGTGVTLGSRNPDVRAPVIGDNVFLGTGAKILGGVTIGNNAVIGANAVVLNDIPENSIAVGIPAKVVKRDIDVTQYNESFFES